MLKVGWVCLHNHYLYITYIPTLDIIPFTNIKWYIECLKLYGDI